VHHEPGEHPRDAAITENSAPDSIRPVVPAWEGDTTARVWLRGKFPSYSRYELEAVVRFLPRRAAPGDARAG
jgi:hypothetical protein